MFLTKHPFLKTKVLHMDLSSPNHCFQVRSLLPRETFPDCEPHSSELRRATGHPIVLHKYSFIPNGFLVTLLICGNSFLTLQCHFLIAHRPGHPQITTTPLLGRSWKKSLSNTIPSGCPGIPDSLSHVCMLEFQGEQFTHSAN